MTGVSDLVGELQEIKSATSTSTAADLLKQGAGWSRLCFDSHLQTLLSSAPNVYAHLSCLPSHKQACNVLYLNSVETECLTGPEAVSKATKCTLSQNPRPAATVVHFKVSSQGITLTDNKRRYDAGHFICPVPVAVTAVFPGIICNPAELNQRGLEDYISNVQMPSGCFSGDTTQSAV